jgi:hypothetical protein
MTCTCLYIERALASEGKTISSGAVWRLTIPANVIEGRVGENECPKRQKIGHARERSTICLAVARAPKARNQKSEAVCECAWSGYVDVISERG